MNTTVEPREPEVAQARALVMDWAAVRWLIGILGSIGGCTLAVGIWTGTTVADHSGRIARLEERMNRIENEADTMSDSQIRPMELTLREVSSSMSSVSEKIAKLDTQIDRLTTLLLNGRDKP